MKSPKRTIDIQADNDRILEMMKQENGQAYGTTINGLIRCICRAPAQVREELISFIKQRMIRLERQINEVDGFAADPLNEAFLAYQEIAKYLNRGYEIDIKAAGKKPEMVRVEMQDGYMLAPDNWIILNPEDAGSSRFAHVVEVNQTKYDVEFPHFVYFHNYERGTEDDSNLYDVIDMKCAESFPTYQTLLDYRNSLPEPEIIYDPETPGKILNDTEIENYPHIGHFPLYVQGDPIRPSNYKPPYGARIIRTGDQQQKK